MEHPSTISQLQLRCLPVLWGKTQHLEQQQQEVHGCVIFQAANVCLLAQTLRDKLTEMELCVSQRERHFLTSLTPHLEETPTHISFYYCQLFK